MPTPVSRFFRQHFQSFKALSPAGGPQELFKCSHCGLVLGKYNTAKGYQHLLRHPTVQIPLDAIPPKLRRAKPEDVTNQPTPILPDRLPSASRPQPPDTTAPPTGGLSPLVSPQSDDEHVHGLIPEYVPLLLRFARLFTPADFDRILQAPIPTTSWVGKSKQSKYTQFFNTTLKQVLQLPNGLQYLVPYMGFIAKTVKHPADLYNDQLNRQGPAPTPSQIFDKRFAMFQNGDFQELFDDLQLWSAFYAQAHTSREADRSTDDPNTLSPQAQDRVNKLVGAGNYAKAYASLTNEPPCAVNEEVLRILREKHPPSSGPVHHLKDGFQGSGYKFHPAQVRKAISNLKRKCAPGPDGWHFETFQSMAQCPNVLIRDECMSLLATVFSRISSEFLAPEFTRYYAAARLVPLSKPGGGIRPVAVGNTFRRLLERMVFLRASREAQAKRLFSNQLGAGGVSRAIDAAIHLAQRTLTDSRSSSEDLVAFQVDAINAFNRIKRSEFLRKAREWLPSTLFYNVNCYQSGAALYVHGSNEIILSLEGVQQGGPMSGLNFCLGIQGLLDEINDAFGTNLQLHVWYQDDGHIQVPRSLAVAVIQLLLDRGPKYGFHLNLDKTGLFSPTIDLQVDPLPELPPSLIRLRLEEGVEFLGGVVSFTAEGFTSFVQKKIDRVALAWNRLANLDDPHVAYTLFRMCGGLVQFQHLFATIDPSVIWNEILQLDHAIISVMQGIFGHPISGDLFDIISLPIRAGGLGILSASRLAPIIFGCSKVATLDLVHSLLPEAFAASHDAFVHRTYNAFIEDFLNRYPPSEPTSIAEFKDEVESHVMGRRQFLVQRVHDSAVMSIREHLSDRALANFNALFAPLASDWLTALPSDVVRFDPHVFRLALLRRYGLEIFPHSSTRFCPLCQAKVMDTYGDHALVCKNGGERTKRHDELVRVLLRTVKSVVSSASLEEPGLLVNGTRQRPGDIYVPSLSHGQSYAIDVTVVSHTRAAFRSKLRHVKNIGCVAQSGVEVKMKKFADSCTQSGLVFVPFALDAGGGYSKSAMNFVHLICSLAQGKSNCSLPVLKRRLRDQIAVVIQKWHSYSISNRINYSRSQPWFHRLFEMSPRLCSVI